MKLDEFYEKLAYIARYSWSQWFVGSYKNPTNKSAIRCFHNGNAITGIKRILCKEVCVVDLSSIQTHWKEICPIEAVALEFGFQDDRRPKFPQRHFTVFDLGWRIGLQDEDKHRIFRATDSNCLPIETFGKDHEVREKLLEILKPKDNVQENLKLVEEFFSKK